MMKALQGLTESRKALVMLAVMVTLTTLLALGRISEEQYTTLVTFVMPSWFISHAYEEKGKAKG